MGKNIFGSICSVLMVYILCNLSLNLAYSSSYNIASASDWGCDEGAKNVAKYVNMINPELVLIPGDLSYEKTGKCFFETIGQFVSKSKIAIGNHDDVEDGSKKIKSEYLNFFNLKKSFYSFDYQNTHVLVLDTQLNPNDKEQFDFAKNDLQIANNNAKIDWILVMFHKPMYSSGAKHEDFKSFAQIYHPLFEEFNVNLVLQGHNHIYERTSPLKYINNKYFMVTEKIDPNYFGDTINPTIIKNVKFDFMPNKLEPVLDIFDSNKGTVFVTVGTGGRELHYLENKKPDFIETNYSDGFGFLNIEIIGKIMIGTFYSLANIDKDNDGLDKLEIYDRFILSNDVPLLHETNFEY